MYSESDLDGAVAAGALSSEAARQLRAYVATQRAAPAVDEESFRLITGFNDIFVSIAIALLLAALMQIGGTYSVALGGALVAAASWMLAEFFTARRRMALPSILLLLTFIAGVAGTMIGAVIDARPDLPNQTSSLIGAGIALVTAGAAWIHWRRFAVPVTVAAGALAIVGVAIGLLMAIAPDIARTARWLLLLMAGLGVFALAMRWDLSDRERRTRRADVAFWLHLAAAPLIAHPVFQMLGAFGGDVDTGTALVIVALYVAFAFVALAIDRRALLVSGLVYVLYALISLFRGAGAVELSWALTAFVIGSALLTLSAFWHPMRARVVALLGGLGERLPPIHALAV